MSSLDSYLKDTFALLEQSKKQYIQSQQRVAEVKVRLHQLKAIRESYIQQGKY